MYFTFFKLQELNKKHQVFSLWNIDVERGTFVSFNLGFTLFFKFPIGQDILSYLPKEVLALPNINFSSFSYFTLSFRGTIRIRHSFYRISMLSKVHDGYPGNFSDASF